MKLSHREKYLFFHRLAMLLSAGMPLLDALSLLRDQARQRGWRDLLEVLAGDVENGRPLASSLGKFKAAFGDLAVSVVAVGERSGTLGENLGRLAAEARKAQALRRKAASAMVYPAFVTVATLGVSLTLTAYVFPKILPMFQGLDFPLPWSTRALMRASDFVLRRWPWLIAAVVISAVGIRRALRVPKIRAACDRAVLRVPVLGRLVRAHATSGICRVLAMLLRSGTPIDAAHRAAADAVGHASYKTVLEAAARGLAAGETLSVQLARTPGLYPPDVAQLVAVAERTGGLDEAFDRLARIHEEDLDDLTKDLSTLFEPLLLAAMGLVVGFVSLSIVTPIYALTQHLGA